MKIWHEIKYWAFPGQYLYKSYEELAKLTQDGDEKAFLTIYERLKGPVYNYCLLLLNNQASVAEEITQETFLKALNSIQSFNGQNKFSTWIWTIARNSSYDYLRKNGKVDSSDNLEELSDLNEVICQIDNWSNKSNLTTTEESVQQSQIRDYILECLEKLPINYKESLIMQLFAGMSYFEMSLALKVNENTLKTNLLRAKKNMMSCLDTKDIGVGHE
ncbi:MAG: RNA polymerase sigma factor [Oligoflexia bacterium]|nr:RNA polymerase sigma factor [Oligoflexia bacterium]